ncbi:MAG: GIY-YIG nuclease family protein [Patescibacteria group bacterium]
MYYVYILQSQKDNSPYTGFTTDLKKRLNKHNHKEVRFSSAKAPYNLIWYCGFKERAKAAAFEHYLKDGSGFAFARKHLI